MQKFKIDCGMDMENSKVFVMHFNGKRGINYNHLMLLFNGEVFNKAVRGYKGYATTKCPIKTITELDEDDDTLTIEMRYNCLDIKSIQDAKVFIKFVYLCKKFLKNIRIGRSNIPLFLFFSKGGCLKMKIKFPKLDMPNLKLPKVSSSQNKLTSLFKDKKGFNTDGLIKEAQSRIPEPIKKFIPNMKGSTGKDIDIAKITKGSAFDVDGMLSKNANVDDIMKTFNSGMTLDIDPSSAGVPSDVIKEFTKIM